MKYNNFQDLINNLTRLEKTILKIASNAIYFDDNSDYLSALWEIVNEISNSQIEECNSELFELLND